MQVKNVLISGLLFLGAFASCKKDKQTTTPQTAAAIIEGNWEGKSSILSQPFNQYYSFTFKAGGVLEVKNAVGTKTGEGTWAFYNNDNAITGTYSLTSGATFSIIANFDKVNKKLDGTWGNGQNDYNGGYWYMVKVN